MKVGGRFELVAPDGTELVVPSQKVQALIAMLAVDPRMTRQRAWLQDKLWSDRTAEKGANSLRQALYKVRQAFGDDSDIVSANRSTVSLDANRVLVDPGTTGLFLEGMDVGDQEFEHWLSAERVARISGSPPADETHLVSGPAVQRLRQKIRRGLVVEFSNDRGTILGRQEQMFGDIVQRSVCEMLDIEPVTRSEAAERGGDLLVLELQATSGRGDQTGLRVAVYQGLGGADLWSASTVARFPEPGAPFEAALLNLSHRTSAALTDLLCRPTPMLTLENDPNYFAGAGLRRMYSMLPGSVQEARQMFEAAYDLRPRGLYLAMGAQLAVIDFVESGGKNRADLSAQADELCAKAMVEESTNSMVLSSVAHARMVFDDDLVTAGELSRMGVLANPSNPMAWSALANVMLNCERFDEAAQAAKTAISLSKETFFRYWTEFQFATTAVSLNQNDLAIRHAERARALNPKYRPALRYLIGLHASKDSFDEARRAVTRLQRLEADTSPDRFVNDDKYPVRMMRRAGLIDPTRFQEL
ncbi:hypothetical protein ACMU_17710 [Actibacterium mucosum KCTC 23349]|uniref:Uncharacterized protein n=1 Tax=Actibacterium mucosum KCTC 23349 TaxID=1454373 RepID=A0A037ZG04_9RHOB|nr:hypothetical protein ACMU_17710 [Actibacterium mucosum KCTC 23349]